MIRKYARRAASATKLEHNTVMKAISQFVSVTTGLLGVIAVSVLWASLKIWKISASESPTVQVSEDLKLAKVTGLVSRKAVLLFANAMKASQTMVSFNVAGVQTR